MNDQARPVHGLRAVWLTDMHDKVNSTPYPVEIAFCQDEKGRDQVLALLKASFHFDPGGQVSPLGGQDALPVHLHDAYFGEVTTSSLRYASDVVPSKIGTDVAVNGSVYAGNRVATQARISVGPLTKRLTAFGVRTWLDQAGRQSSPEPFASLPLRYEHAFGGAYVDDHGAPRRYAPNPVGTGFVDPRQPRPPLPRLEFEPSRILHRQDRPPPAGLGFIPSGWLPRSALAGTFDAAWASTRRPLFPLDFDQRFYNAVPQDQVLRPGLTGGEPVVLEHLHPDVATVSFTIPPLRFISQLIIKQRVEELLMHPDTILVEPDQGRFSITFRSTCFLGDDFRFLRTVSWSEVE